MVPRPAASTIPDTTHAINVTETVLTVTSCAQPPSPRGRVSAATVAYFNGLPSVQPGTTSCGSEPLAFDVLTLTFLSRAENGTASNPTSPYSDATPLATAKFDGRFGWRGSDISSQCNPVGLRVGDSAPVDLVGGRYHLLAHPAARDSYPIAMRARETPASSRPRSGFARHL